MLYIVVGRNNITGSTLLVKGKVSQSLVFVSLVMSTFIINKVDEWATVEAKFSIFYKQWNKSVSHSRSKPIII